MLDYYTIHNCVLQTSVRGQVAGHERQDAMTARLLKVERLKVTMYNHVRTTGMIHVHPSSWRCSVQVDRELERATELLKESEDSRESLVQEVCLQLHLSTFAHQHRPLETKRWTAASFKRIRQPYLFPSTRPLILRWKTCVLNWWRWGKRRRSFKASSWKLLSMLHSHVLTTSTGRWEEVDHIGQVMNIFLNEQRGIVDVKFYIP